MLKNYKVRYKGNKKWINVKAHSRYEAASMIGNTMGAGIGLGVGNLVLDSMGQGSIATKISTPASNMLGVGLTAGMGMSIMNMANNYAKTSRPIRVKKGKHQGYFPKGF